MRHARFDVAHLAIEGIDLPLKAAYLLVAEREELAHLDWECLAFALDDAPLSQQRYQVAMSLLFDDRTVTGPAILVRSVEGAHVLRGDGPLDGIAPDDLT
ncbi:MAG: hypothetical protein KDA98_00780 [Acidimicrobiales bacterium]|nr:hypothetical protein [Acidimicrobiales bacterium]